ncbi:MAG: anthranilate phosphoribosyltransferase [Candidatus Bathyarchaeota archaeon]|nr:anthranilate phosphoribosyltransferase [Candidatus Bathyarchaeota archaeon]
MIKEAIQKLVEGEDLSSFEAECTLREIMLGEATHAQIAAFLTALRMKGETVEEITALAKVTREKCCRIRPTITGRLVDTCGTGGDSLKTFNISTAAAFVVAGAKVAVAKHGNRSVTSKSGSADVLEKLGLNLNMGPQTVKNAIEQVGIGFMFAPSFHPAMKFAVVPRKEIGLRSVFNLLGPLTNPANANAQLLGVYDSKLTEPLAYALRNLGCQEAFVVHGLGGLDEISTVGKTVISHLKDDAVTTFEISPESFSVPQTSISCLAAATVEENAKVLFQILFGSCPENDPKMDVVLVNSAAAIVLGRKADDFKIGMEVARESIRSGAAYKKLQELIKASGGDLSRLEELEKNYA